MANHVGVILVAAGRGTRFGGPQNKVLQPLHGRPVWWHSAKRLRSCSQVGPIVLVISPADRDYWESDATAALLKDLDLQTVDGGAVRAESVLAGLKWLRSATIQLVAVHDAARPCVLASDLDRVMQSAMETGAAILARPLVGTIKKVAINSSVIEQTLDRRQLWEALTPQVFKRDMLETAFERWRGKPVTDDAQLVQLAGFSVQYVSGDVCNLKVTTPQDLALAAAILQYQASTSGI